MTPIGVVAIVGYGSDRTEHFSIAYPFPLANRTGLENGHDGSVSLGCHLTVGTQSRWTTQSLGTTCVLHT